ncbi:uncharacterized protein LOC132744594 [Ruditapes philippinarum]|uniref:uncharacterized protein LOC132744594 n=1 Tax=Ruditapes philippinarum TaxID=129788 RepID=UPI00295C1B91|nr:uncharacterized protein LOC132744594 [Ruditapes philippinarum]
MLFSRFYTFVVLFQIYNFQFVLAKEPVCSKFAYEEQLLEKMIRTEIKVETMANEIKATQETVMDTLGVIKKTVQEFTDKFESLQINITERMLEETKKIEKKTKFFEKLYEASRVNLTQEIESQRNSVVKLQEKYERPVIFYAHHVTDVDTDETERIIFNYAIINERSGYDTSTGIFTAPVSGLYQFAVHLCTPISKYVYVEIFHEGNVIMKDYLYGVGENAVCSSVTGIVRVKSGEQVWVQHRSKNSNYKLIEDIHRMNTFLGMIINS